MFRKCQGYMSVGLAAGFLALLVREASAEDFRTMYQDQSSSFFYAPDGSQFLGSVETSHSVGYDGTVYRDVKGAVASSVGERASVGLAVSYDGYVQEYLATVGVALSENVSLIGAVGLLQFGVDELGGSMAVVPEYRASLKATYDWGFVRSLEVNAYWAEPTKTWSEADYTDQLGTSFSLELAPTYDSYVTVSGHSNVKGGFETGADLAEWSLEATVGRYVSESVSLEGTVQLADWGEVYGGGLYFEDIVASGVTSKFGLHYSIFDAGSDQQLDQRLTLSWTLGFGSKSSSADRGSGVADNLISITGEQELVAQKGASQLLYDVLDGQSSVNLLK